MSEKPTPKSSLAAKELDRLDEHFQEFDKTAKELTLDRMNEAPKEETEPRHQLSQNQITNSQDIYLKPKRRIGSKESFNERFRKEYEEGKEYVYFIAENNEIFGEDITLWTKKWPGVPAEEWVVPVNKPIWGPRYLAEQIKNCKYHRLEMSQGVAENNPLGTVYGTMVVDSVRQRLDARPATKTKSVFVAAGGF